MDVRFSYFKKSLTNYSFRVDIILTLNLLGGDLVGGFTLSKCFSCCVGATDSDKLGAAAMEINRILEMI